MTETIIALELVIGVPKAINDPNSNEPELEVINLLNARGFAVEYPTGWTPQLPALKNGGTWADSALAPGRQLIAGEFGNVVETMTLKATGATMTNRLFLKSRLLEFSRRAKAFHTDWSEQQPVYIKWHAPGAPCPQYALIYDIDVSDVGDAFEVYDADTIVITIEREPAWRMGVPPGGNPILWTYFSRDAIPGNTYQYDDLALDSTNSLVTGTANNRHEWQHNSGNPVVTATSKNYVDISASQVPGDAPALVSIGVRYDLNALPLKRLLLWHSSKELDGVDQVAGTAMAGGYIMNAIDMGGGGTPTAGNASTGVNNTAAVPSKQYMSIGLGGTGSVITLTSGDNASATSFTFWYRQFVRGRLAVFVRARQTSGALGDIRLKVTAEEFSGFSGTINAAQVAGQFVNIPLTTNTGDYALIYAGVFGVPFSAKSHIGIDGRGIQLKKYVQFTMPIDFRFTFRFENFTSPTAARTAQVLDAILIPIDESFAEMRYDTFTTSAAQQIIVADNTGYLSRGKPDEIVVRNENATYADTFSTNSMELRGNLPMLLPRRDQRLYFLNARQGNSSEIVSHPNEDMSIFVNIVPRCYGVAAL